MKRLVSSVLLLAAVSSAGCNKKDDTPTPPFTTSFRLLNEQGQQATAFPHGQNIIFRYQIISNSDKKLYFNAPLFDTQHFLEVYNQSGVSVGKPYQGVLCTTIGAYIIGARDTMTFSIPWVESVAYPTSSRFCGHAATAPLPVGHYQTAFNPSVTWYQDVTPTSAGPSYTTSAQSLSLEFDVTGVKGQ